jgi:hypothetical protein
MKVASKVKVKAKTKSKLKKKRPEGKRPPGSLLKCHRFIGISLGGGKSDRTSLTVLDYYVAQNKLVVNRVIDRIKTENDLSADLRLHEIVHQFKGEVAMVALDVPLTLPKCFRCQLKCPGYELCDQEEIIWMWKQYHQQVQKNKNARMFTPYTRRCSEVFWSTELEGHWALGDALGANQAPLLARGRFLTRRWNYKVIEVVPRLSLIRWAAYEKLSKIQVRNHRHSLNGLVARDYILRHLSEQMGLFFYEQDRSLLVDNLFAFDSFWASMTAFWKFMNQCENRPKGFPKSEGWIEVPCF